MEKACLIIKTEKLDSFQFLNVGDFPTIEAWIEARGNKASLIDDQIVCGADAVVGLTDFVYFKNGKFHVVKQKDVAEMTQEEEKEAQS